jgi:hypothetical protein
MKQYNLPEFIEAILIPDLEKMVANHLHYYAFSLICQGVEVMGSVFDGRNLDDHELSCTRFKNGLSHFFKGPKYLNNQTKFFSYLRGPLVHQLRPGEGFVLASASKDNINPEQHLEDNGAGATVLIIEPFLADFKAAFARFKRHLSGTKPPLPERFTSIFINVCEQPKEFAKSLYLPDVAKTITLTPYATGGAVLPKQSPESND